MSDAIRMTVWADLQYFLGGTPGNRVGIFSPDGQKFIVVVRRGNLRDNTNEYSLLLFRTKDAFNSPKPEVLITMSSSSNREGVENVKWLNDNETVAFLGEDGGWDARSLQFEYENEAPGKADPSFDPCRGLRHQLKRQDHRV